MNYILVDASYFIFYRYFALLKWWKHAKPEENLDNPFENEEFVDKFKKTFISKLSEIPKKLKINKIDYKFIFAQDCQRTDIWRINYFPEYKSNRILDDSFMGGPFFKLGFDLLKENKYIILNSENLEADDCIAITISNLLKRNIIEDQYFIIANDMDYLQIVNNTNIYLFNLQFKNIFKNKNWNQDPEKDLLYKIIIGDKSDNIPSIFKKCGPKTAQKCIIDTEFFKEKLEKEKAHDKFNLNKKIIDFKEIPQNLTYKLIKFIEDNI